VSSKAYYPGTLHNVKSFPSHKAYRVALISISLAIS